MESKSLGQPFTFHLVGCKGKIPAIEAQALINKKTSEELSVKILENEVEIKRARKEKKEKQKNN